MAKIKPYHLHKIKIHPNRWLIWAIAYALIIAIGMIGYIRVTDVTFESQIGAENEFQPWRSYADQRLGFVQRYPADWSIEASNKSTIGFIPAKTSSEGVSISVETPVAEKDIRRALDIIDEKIVMVDGKKGKELTSDLGHGAFETVILVTNNNKLFVIRGDERYVHEFLLTFRFTK